MLTLQVGQGTLGSLAHKVAAKGAGTLAGAKEEAIVSLESP